MCVVHGRKRDKERERVIMLIESWAQYVSSVKSHSVSTLKRAGDE